MRGDLRENLDWEVPGKWCPTWFSRAQVSVGCEAPGVQAMRCGNEGRGRLLPSVPSCLWPLERARTGLGPLLSPRAPDEGSCDVESGIGMVRGLHFRGKRRFLSGAQLSPHYMTSHT